MFFCPIHDQLRTLLDHDKLSKEKAVENTFKLCGARFLLSSKQSKRAPPPLSPGPSTDQAFSDFPPVGAVLPAPTVVRSAF